MVELQEIEAIKRLKYRYLRCLDLKLWDDLETCFSVEAKAAYGDGKFSFTGRDQIMRFLRDVLGSTSRLTSHRCHHPEIDLTNSTTATAIWALDDVVIDVESQTTLRGAAFYDDEYVKNDGRWTISFTGYRRIYEEVESRRDTPSLVLLGTWWERPPGA